ncbi:MAG: recombination mediator RecR [Candidatus Nealsonbacteria bacterium]|nr:recombination mediator RecR [Candidatus Nealsonbacteria bacterium]
MYPKSIQKLIDKFSKFPTIGPRTAARFVFYLLKSKKEEVEELVKSISDLSKNIKLCNFCFKPFEGEKTLCEICSDNQRDQKTLCIVEKETDLDPIEKTKKYTGLYFILGGNVSLLKKDAEKIRIEKLQERIKNPSSFGLAQNTGFQELIIATNPTTEGNATFLFLERKLKPLLEERKIKITKLGRGLPTGGELEYADEETLSEALERRR